MNKNFNLNEIITNRGLRAIIIHGQMIHALIYCEWIVTEDINCEVVTEDLGMSKLLEQNPILSFSTNHTISESEPLDIFTSQIY